MAKKRVQDEHEEENSERWLLTYSDLITLLLALFIILYSMAQVDAKKFDAVAEQFREQMGSQLSNKSGNGIGQYILPPGDIVSSEIDLRGSGNGTALDQIYNALFGYVQENNLQDQIELYNSDDYVRIHIKDKLMFVPDSSRLIDPNNPILGNIEKAIEQIYPEIDYITFSGHTADVGNTSLASHQTSWRLSTERAITVLNNFIASGLPESKLSIQGFAHFSPVGENSTEEGRAQNRRVEITIYKYPDTSIKSDPAERLSDSAPASTVISLPENRQPSPSSNS